MPQSDQTTNVVVESNIAVGFHQTLELVNVKKGWETNQECFGEF